MPKETRIKVLLNSLDDLYKQISFQAPPFKTIQEVIDILWNNKNRHHTGRNILSYLRARQVLLTPIGLREVVQYIRTHHIDVSQKYSNFPINYYIVANRLGYSLTNDKQAIKDYRAKLRRNKISKIIEEVQLEITHIEEVIEWNEKQ